MKKEEKGSTAVKVRKLRYFKESAGLGGETRATPERGDDWAINVHVCVVQQQQHCEGSNSNSNKQQAQPW